MKLKSKTILLISFYLISRGVMAESSMDQDKKINEFLSAETTEARTMLSGFSNEFLEKFAEDYKSNMQIKESRKLWLVEESYKRKADKVASDRLFYVFLAVSLLMILIFGLTLKIYQMQKKLESLE